MKCKTCGYMLPLGTAQCPVCGERTDGIREPSPFQLPYGDPDGGQNNQSADGYGFAADDSQNQQNRYATPAFHTYRKQMFANFPQDQQANNHTQPRDGFATDGGFARAMSDLPQVVRGAFVDPMGTLQGFIRRDDRYTGGIMVVLSLILAFLAGMILTKGALGGVFSAMSGLTGVQLADSAASLNQGVGYLAGKVALPIGGIAAACQLIAALVPVVVTMAYLSLLRQVKFSFLLASGLTAIITLPNVLGLLLAAVFSLITPYLSLLVLFFGQVVSYVLLCNLAVQIACPEPNRTVLVQATLVCLSELMKIILVAVVGAMMMGGVIQTLAGLTNSVSGLL